MAAPRTPRTPSTARAEATGAGLAIEFEGNTYTVPPSSEWPLDAMEAAEEGRAVAATRMILGPDQWAKFRSNHGTYGDLERFMDIAGEVAGGNR